MLLGKCPGIAKSAEGAKGGRPSTTAVHCEECSAQLGKLISICNSNKYGGTSSYCHIKYHNKFHSKKYLDEQEDLEERNTANNVL